MVPTQLIGGSDANHITGLGPNGLPRIHHLLHVVMGLRRQDHTPDWLVYWWYMPWLGVCAWGVWVQWLRPLWHWVLTLLV